MNNLFDCLNASNFNSPNALNRPLKRDSESKHFLDEFYNQNELSTKNNRLTCLDGLRLTINGMYFFYT